MKNMYNFKKLLNQSTDTSKSAKVVAENSSYTVYEIRDYKTAMKMGDGTTWTIAGRHGTDGKAKQEQAQKYFDMYKDKGMKILYCIPKKSGSGKKYCICKDGDKCTVFDAKNNKRDSIPSDVPQVGCLKESVRTRHPYGRMSRHINERYLRPRTRRLKQDFDQDFEDDNCDFFDKLQDCIYDLKYAKDQAISNSSFQRMEERLQGVIEQLQSLITNYNI